MRLRAMAKINLGLDIIGKREDGYHEVRMIMQTIRMYDVLEIRKKSSPGISLSTNLPYIPCDERNLVYKAAKILMDEFQGAVVQSQVARLCGCVFPQGKLLNLLCLLHGLNFSVETALEFRVFHYVNLQLK